MSGGGTSAICGLLGFELFTDLTCRTTLFAKITASDIQDLVEVADRRIAFRIGGHNRFMKLKPESLPLNEQQDIASQRETWAKVWQGSNSQVESKPQEKGRRGEQ